MGVGGLVSQHIIHPGSRQEHLFRGEEQTECSSGSYFLGHSFEFQAYKIQGTVKRVETLTLVALHELFQSLRVSFGSVLIESF